MFRSNFAAHLISPTRKISVVLMLVLLVGAGMFTVANPTVSQAYPKPSVVPNSWELRFTHSMPKRIIVTAPGTNTPVAYWYMTFSFTNLTDSEQPLLPSFEMVTKDGTQLRSDRDIPEAAFDSIKKRERNKALEPMDKIGGRILIGEDQAREGVAIWREPSLRMGTFQIFVGGISGESIFLKDGEEVKVKDWTKVSDEERKSYKTMRKTLQMVYQIAGDEIKPSEDKVLDKGEEWLMR